MILHVMSVTCSVLVFCVSEDAKRSNFYHGIPGQVIILLQIWSDMIRRQNFFLNLGKKQSDVCNNV